jgi:hypothetical protein
MGRPRIELAATICYSALVLVIPAQTPVKEMEFS